MTSATASRCRPHGPIPQEVAGCFTHAEPVRPLRDLVRPVHVRRLRQARRDELRHDHGIRAASRASTARRTSTSCATPTTTRRRTARRLARTCPTSSRSRSTRTPTTSSPRIGRGDIEDEVSAAAPPPTVAAPVPRLEAAPHQLGRPHLVPTMNMTQPPFDDVHIRRAVNWSSTASACARHGAARSRAARDAHRAGRQLGDTLKGYAPYGVGRATSPRRRPRSSSPSTTRTTTASATRRPARTSSRSPATARRRRASSRSSSRARGIGITLKDRVLKDAYTPIGEPRPRTSPFSTRPGWGKDYSDPYAFFGANFDGRDDHPDRQHQPRSRRHHAGAGQEARRQGQHARTFRASTTTSTSASRPSATTALHAATRALDKKIIDPGRSVGAVPLGELRQPDLEQNVTQVGLRPVQR